MPRLAVWAVAVAMCVAAFCGSVVAGEADEITGVWLTEEGKARVEIFRHDDRYHGKIVWLKVPTYPEDDPEMAGKPKVDRNNPDEKLRDRPIVGLEILTGFEHKGNREWKKGRIYDPESGKTYKCKIKLDGDRLKVRGYVGLYLLGRTTEWTRYASEVE